MEKKKRKKEKKKKGGENLPSAPKIKERNCTQWFERLGFQAHLQFEFLLFI